MHKTAPRKELLGQNVNSIKKQHPLHTLHKSFFVFQLGFYHSWNNKAQYAKNIVYFLPYSVLKWLHKNSPVLLSFYLFIFRERGREGERKVEKHQCVVASRATHTGGLAHIPACALIGIQPVTFTGWHSIHWATPARAEFLS